MLEVTGRNSFADAAAAHPLLRVEGLSIGFNTANGHIPVTRDVTWDVNAGETLVVIGESGSGKSITASAIMGLLDTPPAEITSGRILFEGQDLLQFSPAQRSRFNGLHAGMVFQDTLAGLNPVLSVGSQIAEALVIHGVARAQARVRALQLLETVGITDPARRYRHFPHQFSGGQRQRIMIAIAIAMNPRLVIADEPTSALDVTVEAQILRLLKNIQAQNGMGMIFITHNIRIAEQIGDRIVVMRDGRVVETGSVEAVLRSPQADYTRQLLSAMPGRRPARPRPAAAGQPILQVANLTKTFRASAFGPFLGKGDGHRAIDDVSLEVAQNEILCLVGESGSGKSTLVKALLGLETVDRGSITLNGTPVGSRSRSDLKSLRKSVQAVFQDPSASLDPLMTVEQLLFEPWYADRSLLPRSRWRDEAAALLERVGLKAEHLDRYPHQFSGGQRQRIAIARALAPRPRLIICDEAVSALDVSVQALILDLLEDLRRSSGVSVFFVTHDLGLVRDFADRVLVMRAGQIVDEGRTEDLFTSPSHPYTRLLLESYSNQAKTLQLSRIE